MRAGNVLDGTCLSPTEPLLLWLQPTSPEHQQPPSWTSGHLIPTVTTAVYPTSTLEPRCSKSLKELTSALQMDKCTQLTSSEIRAHVLIYIYFYGVFI